MMSYHCDVNHSLISWDFELTHLDTLDTLSPLYNGRLLSRKDNRPHLFYPTRSTSWSTLSWKLVWSFRTKKLKLVFAVGIRKYQYLTWIYQFHILLYWSCFNSCLVWVSVSACMKTKTTSVRSVDSDQFRPELIRSNWFIMRLHQEADVDVCVLFFRNRPLLTAQSETQPQTFSNQTRLKH